MTKKQVQRALQAALEYAHRMNPGTAESEYVDGAKHALGFLANELDVRPPHVDEETE